MIAISNAASSGAWLVVLLAGLCSACNAVAGLNEYSLDVDGASFAGECTTNVQCTEAATAKSDGGETVPAICLKPEGKCVELLSEDCDGVIGDYESDDTIVIGSLFSTKGPQSNTNLARQKSAMLAVSQINDTGGIPPSTGSAGAWTKLVMVSCDESDDLMRAGGHLITDLKVPAIIGPNTSQDTIELSRELSVPAGTVLISPTAVASSIVSLVDSDFTWQMVPTDVQRAPLMISQIGVLEEELKAGRGLSAVKLSVIYRGDALGTGTRTALNTLTLNGKSLSNPINLGQNVRISEYDPAKPDQETIVKEHLQFAPDIVVLAGTAEAITHVMKEFEARWPKSNPYRPEYVLIDSVKVSELLALAAANDELRSRVRGTGVTPSVASIPVYDSFKVDYQVAYKEGNIISGMGPAYDATFAVAFALATAGDQPMDGAAVTRGLRKLTGGTQVPIGATRAQSAFQKLVAGESISAIGTFSPLAWDSDGAVLGGTIEMWCIAVSGGKPLYQSSGLTFDLMTKTEEGSYQQCPP